jgi:pyruvyl transferase EpsO
MTETYQDLVRSLRSTIERQLRLHVEPGERVAIVHFPNHRNPGDAAIALGAISVLSGLGAEPTYVCTRDSYRADGLRRSIGTGTIFLNGGGSLGDRWPWEQAFREQVIADFQRNPIVQLPQSINFTQESTLEDARRGFQHPRLTLLFRDRVSFEIGAAVFAAPAALCPDTAFAYARHVTCGPPQRKVLCLGRLDSDSMGHIQRLEGACYVHGDWPYSAAALTGWLMHRLLKRQRTRRMKLGVQVVVERATTTALQLVGNAMVSDAMRHIGRYCVLVTDRLHAHVFATVLGIPHVLVDTRDCKLSAFHETWTSTSPIVRLASTTSEASEFAHAMLAAAHDAGT